MLTVVGYITVNANPTVGFSMSPLSGILCSGSPATLTGSGATSYSWTGGVTNGVPFNPPSSSSYTVTGTDGNGCTDTDVASLTVNPSPTISVVSAPVSGTVCAGSPATLTASGASSYSWTGGITNGVSFTPGATATYTVTGTAANGCTGTASRTITVNSCSFQTQLTPAFCGASNMYLNQSISAVTVSGATNYEFWFVNSGLGFNQSRVKGNSIPTMPLGWITGLQYGNTYQVQVRAFVSGVWQAYGTVCNVSLAAVTPAPQMANCAYTNMTLTSYIGVIAVVGAQDYEYEVTNAVQPYSILRLRGSPTATILLSWFANLQYGRTYNVRARVKVGGVWSSYGNMCTFAMQATNPATQLTLASCNATGLTGTSLISYSAVTGATNYEINISNTSLAYNQTRAKGNSGTSISLSNWSGLQANTSYTVTIRSLIGGQWGLFGPTCTITMGSTVRLANPDVEENSEFNFGISMYPNPLGTGTNPTVSITGADQQEAIITVVDLTGRVITTYQLFVEGDQYATQLNGFPELVAGMYIMQVQIGDKVQSTRFVAE